MNNPNLPKIGKRFSKDYQPNHENTGRKRNVFKEIQKGYELSLDDVIQLLTDLLSLSIEELKDLVHDKKAPALKLVLASAVMTSIKSGNWTQVIYMLDRLFGKSVERKEIKSEISMDIKNLREYLDQLRTKRITKPNK